MGCDIYSIFNMPPDKKTYLFEVVFPNIVKENTKIIQVTANVQNMYQAELLLQGQYPDAIINHDNGKELVQLVF